MIVGAPTTAAAIERWLTTPGMDNDASIAWGKPDTADLETMSLSLGRIVRRIGAAIVEVQQGALNLIPLARHEVPWVHLVARVREESDALPDCWRFEYSPTRGGWFSWRPSR